MINQVTKNASYRLEVTISDPVDAGVTIIVTNYDGAEVLNQPASVDGSNPDLYYYEFSKTDLTEVDTYDISWQYESNTKSEEQNNRLDVVSELRTRYCYISEVKRKLFDVMLPPNFDFSAYTRRASNEIDRALQGLYLLPLELDTTHDNYQQDYDSLVEMASDVATAYIIEDISVNLSSQSSVNMKKEVAFAELNRFKNEKKVFTSISKTEDRAETSYTKDRPRISSSSFKKHDGTLTDDPFNLIYNNFTNRSDHV